MFNNSKICVSSYNTYTQKIKDGLTIAHLSDLHEKEFGTDNSALFSAVSNINPNLICITGDIIAHKKQKYFPENYIKKIAQGLCNIAPCYFVMGNHEKNYTQKVKDILLSCGVKIVDEDVHSIKIKQVSVNISGIPDSEVKNSNILNTANALSKSTGYNIFLTHRPEIYTQLVDKNIDLVLAGHTHAGQIRIPFFSKLYMPGQGFLPKYMQGFFWENKTTMIISRGLGSSGYPTFRLNNPPDLVKIIVNEESNK